MLNSMAKVAQKLSKSRLSAQFACAYNNIALAKVTVFKFSK